MYVMTEIGCPHISLKDKKCPKSKKKSSAEARAAFCQRACFSNGQACLFINVKKGYLSKIAAVQTAFYLPCSRVLFSSSWPLWFFFFFFLLCFTFVLKDLIWGCRLELSLSFTLNKRKIQIRLLKWAEFQSNNIFCSSPVLSQATFLFAFYYYLLLSPCPFYIVSFSSLHPFFFPGVGDAVELQGSLG